MTEIFFETQHENKHHLHYEVSQIILVYLRTYAAARDGILRDMLCYS